MGDRVGQALFTIALLAVVIWFGQTYEVPILSPVTDVVK